MNVTRVKEDITAISYEIMRRSGLSVKFKVKTYYEGINKIDSYYYTSYAYNSGNKKKNSVVLVPKSYIQFDFGTDDGKSTFFLSEVYKNRLVRKLEKLAALLDGYDNKEIDIIKTDQSGTHIDNKVPTKINVNLGVHKASITACIREQKLDIGVIISIDNMSAIISMYDFLDLVIKLKSINYTQMSMLLLNHIGAPDQSHEIDFRPSKIVSNEDRETEFNSISRVNNDFNGLKVTNNDTKKYSSLKW